MAHAVHTTTGATARASSEKSTRALFLSALMADAWAICRAQEIAFAEALKEAWAHARAATSAESDTAEVAIRNLAEAIDRFIASTTAAELPETADLAHTATVVLDILNGDPDLEPDDEHDEDGHDAEAWSDDNGIGDREGLLEQTARHQALMRRRSRERSGDGR